jgi:hypothetical protein
MARHTGCKIEGLERLREVLGELVGRCKGGTVPARPIIEALYTEAPGSRAASAGAGPALHGGER